MKNRKRNLFLLLSAVGVLSSAAAQPLPEWQSQYAVGLNKLDPHAYVWPYAATEED